MVEVDATEDGEAARLTRGARLGSAEAGVRTRCRLVGRRLNAHRVQLRQAEMVDRLRSNAAQPSQLGSHSVHHLVALWPIIVSGSPLQFPGGVGPG
jgi:hypothetical protein